MKLTTNAPSYAELARQVVQASPELLTREEIMQRIEGIRPITTRSPLATIRQAVTQCRLLARGGAEGYGWYPRMVNGACVRVPLFADEMAQEIVGLDSAVRDLLCPSFFAEQSLKQKSPIYLTLPTGERAVIPLEFYGEGVWGTSLFPGCWRWLKRCRAQSGDALLLTCVDGEAREYRIAYEAPSQCDPTAIRARTLAVTQAAREHLWRNRAHGTAEWDLAQHLLATGAYHEPVAPAPFEQIWQRVFLEARMLDTVVEEHRYRKTAPRRSYQLHLQLLDSEPAIWRRVLVPETTTLGELHWVVQLVMGWTNSHLHQFRVDDGYYSELRLGLADGLDDIKDQDALTLGKLSKQIGKQFVYEYDFGDGWRHVITLEDIQPFRQNEAPLRCLAGARACPPEDCGGLGGYAQMLEELHDLNHPERAGRLRWLGGAWDAEAFDVSGADWLLAKLASVFAQKKKPVQRFGWYRA